MIDVSRLTDKHRLVMENAIGGGTYETGLYEDTSGALYEQAAGICIRYPNGEFAPAVVRIVKVIAPPFVPKPGMVLTLPEYETDRDPGYVAVRLPDRIGGEDPWLASPPLAANFLKSFFWHTDADIAELVADGTLVEAVGSDE